jgi:hypothetical protein
MAYQLEILGKHGDINIPQKSYYNCTKSAKLIPPSRLISLCSQQIALPRQWRASSLLPQKKNLYQNKEKNAHET